MGYSSSQMPHPLLPSHKVIFVQHAPQRLMHVTLQSSEANVVARFDTPVFDILFPSLQENRANGTKMQILMEIEKSDPKCEADAMARHIYGLQWQ
jgi:hypothetical protein